MYEGVGIGVIHGVRVGMFNIDMLVQGMMYDGWRDVASQCNLEDLRGNI